MALLGRLFFDNMNIHREATQVPINSRLDGEDVIYIYVYTHIQRNISYKKKKDEILPLTATWTDLENIILSEARQR